jgi:predicted alpha/beta-fold hydrolase
MAPEIRSVIEHALRAFDAGMYGEAWLALKDAMAKLEAENYLAVLLNARGGCGGDAESYWEGFERGLTAARAAVAEGRPIPTREDVD